VRRALLLLLGALLATGCGGDDDDRPQIPGDGALTIYSSLPMHGASSGEARAVVEGMRLALDDRNRKAAGREIKLVALDSSKPDGDTWDPELVEQNAERAADDPTAIAYLGELDHGASAISLPVTNAEGILQVSPMDGLTSLTREQPGGPRGGPERYYPGDTRTFVRLVPVDLMHATALVDWAQSRGARRIAIVHDNRLSGRSIAAQATYVADARKLEVAGVREVEAGKEPAELADDARAIADDKPDAVVYAGLNDATAGPLLAAIARARPGAELYVTGIPPAARPEGANEFRVVSALRPAREYGDAGAEVIDRYGRFPEVLYGYESMRLALEAIDRGGPDRAAVVREALRPGPRNGVLGRVEITRSGDVADQRVAAYTRDGAGLTYEGLRTVRPPAPPAP
jgi:branched-chain amino acid transport system substrate-binding protein